MTGVRKISSFFKKENTKKMKPDSLDKVDNKKLAELECQQQNTLSAPKKTFLENSTFVETDWYKNAHDINGHAEGHKDFDPHNIAIPAKIMSGLTPSVKRYFEVKANYWDYIVFFKIGKFYEIFDRDAVICHSELGLNYMKNQHRPHVGVPESVFEKYAAQLVSCGHKVVRVDQVETVKEMEQRVKKTKSPKVVKRGVTSVITPGANFDMDINQSNDSVYLLSLTELQPQNRSECRDGAEYGVAFCDSATSKIFVGSFADDFNRTQLRTLLASIRPRETVEPRGALSPATEVAIKALCCGAVRNKSYEFLDASCVVDYIRAKKYCLVDSIEDSFIEQIKAVCNEELGLTALGGLLKYLERLLLDRELFSQRKILKYEASRGSNRVCLDGSTLINLEIFENEEGNSAGTLFAWLNKCNTPMGSRMLKKWTESPLCELKAIEERLDAIDDFIRLPDLASAVRKKLKKLPDIERILGRIYSFTYRKTKIVLCENADLKYIKMFSDLISGLKTCRDLIKLFRDIKVQLASNRLFSISDNEFPEIEALLDSCEELIDLEKSLDSNYDRIKSEIASIHKEREAALEECRKAFGDKSIRFAQSASGAHQLEISNTTLMAFSGGLSVPKDYLEVNRTRDKKRFSTRRLEELSSRLAVLLESKNELQKSILKKVFGVFCGHMQTWEKVADVIAEIDCLLSLYVTSAFSCGAMCRPLFLGAESRATPFLEIIGSWHPCVCPQSPLGSSAEFVPNEIVLGDDGELCETPESAADDCMPQKSCFVMVTGPNMGGKSTILRQSCVAVILAQMGCYVPASSCRLTLADKIFTRIGANDAILANKSTFFVELEETSNILNNATKNSLVVLDELGRGTSTFDGTAIALAVADYLANKIKCRTLFSTHYHMLSKYYENKSCVKLYHLAYSVLDERILFLYKFVKGICSDSHGINCAKLAGIDLQVIKRAETLSHELRLETDQIVKDGNISSRV